MATGFTHDVREGKSSFAKFVWSCAQAFFYRGDMTVDTSSAKYYEESLARAKKDLAAIRAESEQDKISAADKSYQDSLRSEAAYAAERALWRQRYNDMIVQVTEWTPPSEDHKGLKDFMLSQLRDSVTFDCAESTRLVRRVDPEEFYRIRLENAHRDVGHYTRELAKAREDVVKKKTWLEKLKKSVPISK